MKHNGTSLPALELTLHKLWYTAPIASRPWAKKIMCLTFSFHSAHRVSQSLSTPFWKSKYLDLYLFVSLYLAFIHFWLFTKYAQVLIHEYWFSRLQTFCLKCHFKWGFSCETFNAFGIAIVSVTFSVYLLAWTGISYVPSSLLASFILAEPFAVRTLCPTGSNVITVNRLSRYMHRFILSYWHCRKPLFTKRLAVQ